jgi:hypothetical protein
MSTIHYCSIREREIIQLVVKKDIVKGSNPKAHKLVREDFLLKGMKNFKKREGKAC